MRSIIVCCVSILLSLSVGDLAELAENDVLKETQRLAREGDSLAQFDLGLMYYKGKSVILPNALSLIVH